MIVCGVFIHPAADDNDKIEKFNYEATKLAIRRALANEPGVEELIANRHKIRHDMDDWS